MALTVIYQRSHSTSNIPGHFDMPAEGKVDKIKAKCWTIYASLSLAGLTGPRYHWLWLECFDS